MKILFLATSLLVHSSCQYKENNTAKEKADKVENKMNRMNNIQRKLLNDENVDLAKAVTAKKRLSTSQNISSMTYESCLDVKSRLDEYIKLGENLIIAEKHPDIKINNKSLMVSHVANASDIKSKIKCDDDYTNAVALDTHKMEEQFDFLERRLNNKAMMHFVDNGDHFQLINSVTYNNEYQNLVKKVQAKIELDRFIEKASVLKFTDYNVHLKLKLDAAKKTQAVEAQTFDINVIQVREYEINEKMDQIGSLNDQELKDLLELVILNKEQALALKEEANLANTSFESIIFFSEQYTEQIKTKLDNIDPEV